MRHLMLIATGILFGVLFIELFLFVFDVGYQSDQKDLIFAVLAMVSIIFLVREIPKTYRN